MLFEKKYSLTIVTYYFKRIQSYKQYKLSTLYQDGQENGKKVNIGSHANKFYVRK